MHTSSVYATNTRLKMTSFKTTYETTDETPLEVSCVDTPKDDISARANPKTCAPEESLVGTVNTLSKVEAKRRAKEEERARRAAKAHRRYQMWSFLGFVIIFSLLGGMEVAVLLLLRGVPASPKPPLGTVIGVARELEAAASYIPTHPNATLAQKAGNVKQIMALVKKYEQVVAVAYTDTHTMALYCIAPVAIEFVLFLLVGVFFVINRDSKEVKSRGRPFLIHFFIAGVLTHISSAFLTFVPCLLFVKFPRKLSLTNAEDLAAAGELIATEVLIAASATLSCVLFTLGALMQRQRIIRQIFDKSTRLNRDLRYMKLFWVHFVTSGIVVACLIVWRIWFALDVNQRFWALGSLLGVIIFYMCYFLFLIFATKHAVVVFSDFALNVRAFVWLATATLAIVIFHLIYPHEVALVFFAYAAVSRAAVTISLIDIAFSLMLIHNLATEL